MPALAEVAREKLDALARAGRKRGLLETHREEGMVVMRGKHRLISFSHNDYMGLLHHPDVKAAANAATQAHGTGAGASRLVTGNHPLYTELERGLAQWKGMEAALVFGSGFLTNLGVIPALAGKGDLILADRLVHASIIDGAQLSGAKLARFKHNDLEDCARLLSALRGKYRHCLIVTDEVFSMDGDLAPLEALHALAKSNDAWLMADGAHSFKAQHGPVDVYVGTLSKALGSYGGYVAGSRVLIDYLATAARSVMFSTGLPPACVAAASAALALLRENPGLPDALLAKAQLFTQEAGLPKAQSAIVPVILGGEERALAAAGKLEEEGFLAVAIRPPTVPEGTSRLRFAFCALHEDADIRRLAGIVKREGWA